MNYESRDHIRMHLSHVAMMFSEGNFNIPMFVHDKVPPGVPTMRKLHNEIHYRYQQTEAGDKIVIDTARSKRAQGCPPVLAISNL